MGEFGSHLYDNLIPQQGEVLATFTVRHLEIVGHLQGLLVGIQAHTVLGWKVANASQHFSLPPVRIRIVDDSHLRKFSKVYHYVSRQLIKTRILQHFFFSKLVIIIGSL